MAHEPVPLSGLPPTIGPFSRAVHVGDLLYIAGTTALSNMTGDYHARKIPGTIEAQARMTLDNVRDVVEAAGGKMSDIFKVVIMLKNPADYAKLNAVRAEYFRDKPPISTCFSSQPDARRCSGRDRGRRSAQIINSGRVYGCRSGCCHSA